MGQEWDFPPRREWMPEVIAEKAPPLRAKRYDRLIDHHSTHNQTAWQWYKIQMQSKAPILYKLNVTALLLTLCGFILAVIGGLCLVVTLLVIQNL
jgi:hypothetical protein